MTRTGSPKKSERSPSAVYARTWGASWLRHTYAREHNLGDVMQLQAELWMGNR